MRRSLVFLALAALLLPAAALAKGPSEAKIEGPGLDRAVVVKGGGESPGAPLGDLTEAAGFFPAVFNQQPDPMLATRPKGDLGPKYTITYGVPGPNNDFSTVRQDLYPYAEGGPVTYMRPGQPIFETERTRGGWYRASSALTDTLIDAGLPATAPPGGTSDGREWPQVGLVALLAALLLALLAGALVMRRRTGTAPAH